MNIHALVFVSLALGSLVLPTAHGQLSSGGAGPGNQGRGGVVTELAARSTDDDDDSSGSGSHSSTGKKKAGSNGEAEKSSAFKSAAAKKEKNKKKKLAADDDHGASATGSEKKSGISKSGSPSRNKKKPQDGGDDAAAQAKPKSPDAKPPKDAAQDATATAPKYGPDASVEPDAIVEFARQPERVQRLITAALDLTKLNLTYTYGSAEPSNGGMDCSGAIYYLLRSQGFQDVPRDSSGQYVWARKQGCFFAVVSTRADSFEFKDLMPGDLMFWSGTYEVERDIPITHVMLYLGNEKRTGKRILFGASDGRSYDGVQRWGVSVFDFKMPKKNPNSPNNPDNPNKGRVDFVGYARIPGLRESLDSSQAGAGASEENKLPAKNATAKGAEESTPAPKKKSAGKKTTPRKRAESSDSR